jgi:DNA (cytosine-5)-methyltransferase 1
MKNQRIRYIDLFAGCGGLSEGFESVGEFVGVAHVEWEAEPANTLRRRLRERWRYTDADARVICADIQQLPGLFAGGHGVGGEVHCGLDAHVKDAGGVDVVIGGPPCQAYSLAGRIRDANGMQLDYRNYLFESYLDVVRRYRPRMVVFENVPGLLSAAPGGVSIVDRVSRAFSDAGYLIPADLRTCMFDMAEFGVPQSRKRVIIIGVAKQAVGARGEALLQTAYTALRDRRSDRVQTVKDAIGHLPPLYPVPGRTDRRPSHTEGRPAVPDHEPRYHSRRDQQIFRLLARDAASRAPKLQDIETLKTLYTKFTGKVSNIHKYHVLRPNSPSNLIPAHLYKDGLRHIHFDPLQARSLTVREAACLQGFPADFQFVGSQGARYKMIGNAVPPSFAAYIAHAIATALSTLRRTGKPRLDGRASGVAARGPRASPVSHCA